MRKSIHRGEYQVLVELLRERREAKAVTQMDLSRLLERSQSFVSDVERGQRRLDVIELRDICIRLNIDFLKTIAELERRLRSAASPDRRRR